MKKAIYILSFILLSAISYGQTKVTIRGNNGGGSTIAPTITTSSATTLILTTATTNEKTYVFTGSSATVWTLPVISNSSTYPLQIKNRGTANITLQRAGSDQLYLTSATNFITIFPGDAVKVQKDGTYWIIQ
jgi:hypothetical protein